MAPTCDSSNNGRSGSSEEDVAVASSAAATTTAAVAAAPEAACSVTELTAEDLDCEPFYGMFDRHADDDVEEAWSVLPLPLTSRASIPEASETFQRALRQLDGIDTGAGLASSSIKTEETADAEKCEPRKSCPVVVVKKAASFSAHDCHSSSSSSSSRDSAALAAEAKRRRSVPCMARGKHVQWVDEAGVADLVSVRLIRPRLQAKGEKEREEGQVSVPRSILRRLTGLH